MIELPRAALRAGELAEHAEFFSFGTNDLTQTTLGFSRDDAQGRFLTYYLEHGILTHDPFQTIDVDGVGELVRIAVRTRPRDAARDRDRDLRRARRRPGVDRVLRGRTTRLRLVLAISAARRTAGGRSGGARGTRPSYVPSGG